MKAKLKTQSQFNISEVLQVYRDQKNYEVMNLNSEGNLCIIYFSSNGLYYPNKSSVFHEIIAVQDRYEWKKNILRSARKVIFVRDIKKQWYIEGINAQVNSIEKLCQLLKDESEGLDVICVGNSAGGYAATLIGSLMKASLIFSFSGQFSLLHQLSGEVKRSKNLSLVKYENVDNCKQYYSLINLIKQNQVPIFYFYPAKSEKDRMQSELVKEIPNVYSFAFDSEHHARTCWRLNFIDLFKMELKQLLDLHDSLKEKIISPYVFSNKVSGYIKTFTYLIQSLLKKLFRNIFTVPVKSC